MNIDLEKILIRKANSNDRSGLTTMSRTIWSGSDYLPQIMDMWIRDKHFFVAEYNKKIIGCVKLTEFPDNVLWYEGLRVHGRYQGKGVGKLLNQYVFNLGLKIRGKNPALSFEFCTYYHNNESLKMASKVGFNIVEKYYCLDKKGISRSNRPFIQKGIDRSFFIEYSKYIPCGWQAVHNCNDSVGFIQKKGKVFCTPHHKYYISGLVDKYVLLLTKPDKYIYDDLPYLQYFYGLRKKISIIIPEKWKGSISLLKDIGFRFWEQPEEPNMYILQR